MQTITLRSFSFSSDVTSNGTLLSGPFGALFDNRPNPAAPSAPKDPSLFGIYNTNPFKPVLSVGVEVPFIDRGLFNSDLVSGSAQRLRFPVDPNQNYSSLSYNMDLALSKELVDHNFTCSVFDNNGVAFYGVDSGILYQTQNAETSPWAPVAVTRPANWEILLLFDYEERF